MAGIRVIAVTVNKDRFTAKYVPSRSLCHRDISFHRCQFTVMFDFNCELHGWLMADIGDFPTAIDRFDAILNLKAKGYIRYGCYGPTDDSTDQRVDGATSMFLVFKASNDATHTSIDSALVVRPQYKDGVVNVLAVSDNRAWIVPVLKKREYNCNGFSVDKPAGNVN